MKSYSILLLLLSMTVSLHSQTVKEDPFEDYHNFRDCRQLLAVPLYPSDPMGQEFYDYVHLPGFNDTLMAGPQYDFPDSLSRPYDWESAVDMVTGNFCGDRLDEIAVTWRVDDGSLAVAVMDVEENTHYRSIIALWTIDASQVYWSPDAYTHHRSVRVEQEAP